MPSPGRICALDVGTKTCGLACTDELRITVQPLKTLKFSGLYALAACFNELTRLFAELSPKIIVVGKPQRDDGTPHAHAQKIDAFVAGLQKHLARVSPLFQPQWAFVDEALTTFEAEDAMRQLGIKKSRRQRSIDAQAAVFILRRYLEERG